MNALFIQARFFWEDDSGVTSIEYALIASLIAIMVVGGATLIGEKLAGFFTSVADGFPP
jgi:pilus assembly protein Flp/PilA